MSIMKGLSTDVVALQKRLGMYEDKFLESKEGDDIAYLKEMIVYYKEEVRKVRDALLEQSKLNLNELKGRS